MAKEPHPGNSVASAAAFTRELVAFGEQLMRFSDMLERGESTGTTYGNITLRPPVSQGGEWLAIMRARTESGQYVAFVSARSFAELLRVTSAKLENNTLKWKVDTYAQQT